MREEIKYILQALEVKSQSAASYRMQLIEVLDDPWALISFAEKLKQEAQLTKDFPDDRLPFYDLYLAVAWQKSNFGTAKELLSKAVHNFRIRDFAQDEALGEWLFSVFHFENQKYDRAQRACEAAINTLQQLITRCEEESKYEKARELKNHLSRLRIFDGFIRTMPAAESPKNDSESSDDSGFSEAFPDPMEKTSVRSRLQYFHTELDKIDCRLKEQNLKIPLTLIAAKFYIFKLLAPSHSVYSKVPDPETNKEKEIYNELLKKIGFFEVIEQLVELEREFQPTANREELLELINIAWDKETSQ